MIDAVERDLFSPPRFAPKDPDFRARFANAVEAQPFLVLIGARQVSVEPGMVSLGAEMRPDLTQNLGYAHGGVTATLLDVAGGFAASTLMPPELLPLTVELKINLLAPGKGVRLLAHGRVLKPGRTLTIAESRVIAIGADGGETVIGTALGTFIATPLPKGQASEQTKEQTS